MVLIHNAETTMALHHVHVCPTTLELHLTVDLNVYKILNVQMIKLASERNVQILVQALVDIMPNAKLSIIHQYAPVQMVS